MVPVLNTVILVVVGGDKVSAALCGVNGEWLWRRYRSTSL